MRIPAFHLLLLIGLMVAAGGPLLQAQERTTIAQLETFRDSLTRSGDSAWVNDLARTLSRSARSAKDPVATLRAALAQLRLAELTDGQLFSSVRRVFQGVEDRQPSWAYPTFGIGLAELGRARWMASNPAEIGNRVGYGPYRSAIQAFARALEKNRAFETPGLLLAVVTRQLHDSTLINDALNTLRPLVAGDSVGTGLLLMVGRLERDVGQDSAALTAFLRARGRPEYGELADLEAARTMLALGEESGAILYYETAASSDSAVVAEYRSDLEPIAEEGELAEFDRASGQDRVTWLNRFWLVRDYHDLRSPGERLQEHYRRLYYARRHFALQINRRYTTSLGMFRNLDDGLDDRGVVYIRQGEPDLRIRPPLFALNANETWVYRRPGGDLLLHFGAGGHEDQGAAVDDYRLVHSVADLYRAGGHADMLLLSRVPASPIYDRILAWGPYGQSRALAEEQRVVEASAITGVTTDDYQLRYEHQLDVAAQLLVIGRSAAAQLHLVFAINDTTTGPVRIRLRLFDAALNPTTAVDTTIAASRMGHMIWPVPSGTWTYRVAIEQGSAGRVFPTDSVKVSNSDGPGLSDIALATPDAGISWEPVPGDSVLLSGSSGFKRGRSVEAYYEVYGLAPGQPYQSSIVVLERGGRERQKLNLVFKEQSGAAINRLHRTVRLEGLKRGSYWLEVRIRSASGEEERVRRAFQVE